MPLTPVTEVMVRTAAVAAEAVTIVTATPPAAHMAAPGDTGGEGGGWRSIRLDSSLEFNSNAKGIGGEGLSGCMGGNGGNEGGCTTPT